MEDKEKEGLYHEIVQNDFAFSKSLTNAVSGGKKNIVLENEFIEETIKNLKSLLQELPEK